MPLENASSGSSNNNANQGAKAGNQAPAPKAPPSGVGAERNLPPDEQHQSAAERAAARAASRPKGGAASKGASDSPAAGLSSGKTAIQKERGLIKPGKSALEVLREKSRKFNANVKPVEREVVADDAALPGKGPSEVEGFEEPEVEALAPAPGETELPNDDHEPSRVSDPVGEHERETPPEGEGLPLEEGGEPAADGEVTDYTPNLKYRAFGKEHDIPERFQGLITDVDSEREVHQVFEKAHAMDHFKNNLTQMNSFIKERIEPEVLFHRQTREEFNQLIQRGDIFGIMEKMKIPREKVLQAVAQRIRIEQLPPEERQVYEAREQAEVKSTQAESRVQELESRVQNFEVQAKQFEIQSTFARGDVQSVGEEFDSKMGRPGAFEELVLEHGAFMFSQGKNIPVLEAVNAVMKKFGLKPPAQGTSSPGSKVTSPVASKKPAQQANGARPNPTRVLPNVQSKAVGATRTNKPQINNLEDLKKFGKQMRGR